MKNFNILRFTEIPSTNDYAWDNLEKLADRTIVVAQSQTAGRGRYERKWLSPAGENIYCSIILKNFTCTEEERNYLTIILALAVKNFLQANRLSAVIKWPNDVLVNKQKICGILAKAGQRGIVLGFGFNVNMTAANLAQVDQPATSLKQALGKDFDKDKVLNKILENFFKLLENFDEQVVLIKSGAITYVT